MYTYGVLSVNLKKRMIQNNQLILNYIRFLDTYGDYGYTSWEFPEMVTREKPLINDSDGRNYPWYGSSHQVVTINGPISTYI